MAISKLFTKTAARLLEAVFSISGANIKTFGDDHIPEQSALYVINHFTRIETTFLPYIIYKKTGKLVLSLAHHQFFGGTFGKILGKLGCVSTNDPDRDKILIGALLRGDMSIIIFPEGQMLKDKKLIEKGKYMVYNTGIRRPPHTGAAILALMAQFYREKLKFFIENNNKEEIKKYSDYFNLKKKNLNAIMNNETYIVPVNLTYFPIRAKNNAINKLAGKFVKNISQRLEEEIQVEGTMLLKGVDIDINFGEPININDYLYKSKKAPKKISDNMTHLENNLKKELSLNRVSIALMHHYMDSIYDLTTVNHDHILSYILLMTPKRRILETHFKNKAFLAIMELQKTELVNCHETMKKNQFHILTDDEYQVYDNFVEAAKSDGLIEIKDGYLIKNKSRFGIQYKFHTIRRDNIVAVIKNEIEPLGDVIKVLQKSMFTPPIVERKKIRDMFLKLDNDLFEQDYSKYSIPEESKPKNIGRPFLLKRSRSKKGVILVHGYLAAPEEIRVAAEYLYEKGYTVYGARLRGHGTAPEDLFKRTWIDWYRSLNRAYIIMDNLVDEFAIVGFSTGAGLALLKATKKGRKLKGVISVNAPLKLQNITSNLSSAVVAWNSILRKLNVGKGKLEYITNTPENPHINYFRNPVRGVNELGKLMDVVEESLHKVEIPTLIIQGSNDPVVNPVSGLEIFDKIGTTEKEIYRIYSKRHGIVRGDESIKVVKKIDEFLCSIFC